MTTYEKFDLFIGLITLALFFVGTYIAYIQLKKISSEIKSNHDWNRRAEALKAIDVAKDPNQSKDLEILEEKVNYFNRKDPIPISEIMNISQGNEMLDLKEIIRRRLNTFELFCIGISQGV